MLFAPTLHERRSAPAALLGDHMSRGARAPRSSSPPTEMSAVGGTRSAAGVLHVGVALVYPCAPRCDSYDRNRVVRSSLPLPMPEVELQRTSAALQTKAVRVCAAVKEALREVLDQSWACVRSRGRDARACSRSLKKKGDDREDADPECRADHDPQADAPGSRERISRSRDDSRMGVFARHLWLPSMNTTAYARSCRSIKRH